MTVQRDAGSNAWTDPHRGTMPAPEPAAGGGTRQDESTDLLYSATGAQAWQRKLDRHLPCRVWDDAHPGTAPPEGELRGRLRSGVIGSLRYCRLWINTGRSLRHFVAQPEDHQVVLLVSGRVQLQHGRTAIDLRAGDLVLVNPGGRIVGEHQGPVETVILSRPLDPEMQARFGQESLVLRHGRSGAAVLLSRWLQDACADHGVHPSSAELIAQALSALLNDVLNEQAPSAPHWRLTRAAIEQRITECLNEPQLGPQFLAERLGCSARTLHRLFHTEGGESLERYIQRRRIEACAELLRRLPRGISPQLTRLAMEFGFASASHFSTAFRKHFGVAPSEYRARIERT